MNKKLLVMLFAVSVITGCSDDDPVELPVSPGSIIDVQVGGPTQPNQVFVDLSLDNQTGIDRSSWDLGFHNGNTSAVVINAASEVMAREIPKSNLADVTVDDYEGFYEQTTVDGIFSYLFAPPPYPEWFDESQNWIDDPAGDLTKTAINIEAGNVYYINRGFTPTLEARGSYLIKLTVSGSSYTLEYRNTDNSEISSVSINKSEGFNYSYFDFDNGVVQIDPAKDLWDIAFTTYMEKLEIGPGTFIPYRFQDYVIQNRSNVKVATIEISSESDLLAIYDSFGIDDVSGLSFSSQTNAIGANWRTVESPTPGSVTGVKEDRFYVIKDASGNDYKLLFTQMLNNAGERGYPQITYELIK
jgi:hypothetical protein